MMNDDDGRYTGIITTTTAASINIYLHVFFGFC